MSIQFRNQALEKRLRKNCHKLNAVEQTNKYAQHCIERYLFLVDNLDLIQPICPAVAARIANWEAEFYEQLDD